MKPPLDVLPVCKFEVIRALCRHITQIHIYYRNKKLSEQEIKENKVNQRG